MFPEFVIVLSILVAVLCYAFASAKYGVSFFYKQLALAFGYEALVKVSNFGTFERNMLLRFHNSRKQLTIILIFWRVLFAGTCLSLFWFINQFGFFYPVILHTINYFSLEFVTSTPRLVSGVSDLLFGSHFYHDGFTFNSRFFLLFLFLLFLIVIRNELFQESKLCNLEFLVLYTFGTLFCMFLVSSFSLISFFLSAEGLVITMYLLAASGIHHRLFSKFNLEGLHNMVRYRSLEGALKYSIFNVLSTFFLLFGSLLLFMVTRGSLFFSSVSLAISNLHVVNSTAVPGFLLVGAFLGILCFYLSFCFKLGLFPFSSWVPDLYESTIPLNMVYFLIIPKAAIMLGFINVYRFFFIHFYSGFFILCSIIGVVSIIYGSLAAINQTKISRIMAYSSVTYAGLFVLLTSICFLPFVKLSHLAIVFVIVYMCVLLFFLVIYMALRYSPYYFTYTYVTQFRFAQARSKTFQTFLVSTLFSLSGIPPLFGWLLKFIFLIALIKLFSFSLLNDTSYWVPADLFVNFFQQYDAHWIIDGTWAVQQSLHTQLLAINSETFVGSFLNGNRSFGYMFLDTKWAITPGIKLYSYTVYHNKPEIFANWFLDGIRYLGRHHAVSIPITTTWFTTSGTKLYSYTVYHNNSVLLFDTVNAFFVLVKDGFLSLFSTKATAVNIVPHYSFFNSCARLFLINDTSLFFSYYLSTPAWFLVTLVFTVFFILFLITVLSTFYYIRILKNIYTAPKHAFLYYNQNTGAINVSFSMCALVLFLCAVNLLGVFFFQFINNAIFFLFCFNSVGL